MQSPRSPMGSQRSSERTDDAFYWKWLGKQAIKVGASFFGSMDSSKSSKSPLKQLSPQIESLLCQVGQSKWKDIFEAKKIDSEMFRKLTEEQLEKLGVLSEEDRKKLMKAVKFASELSGK